MVGRALIQRAHTELRRMGAGKTRWATSLFDIIR